MCGAGYARVRKPGHEHFVVKKTESWAGEQWKHGGQAGAGQECCWLGMTFVWVVKFRGDLAGGSDGEAVGKDGGRAASAGV